MAIDPNPPTRAADDVEAGPRINDDLPAYRAISGLAIASLILGLASVFTFTSSYFALLGVASIVLALLARRTIRRYPDAMTGEKIAQAGVAVSLLFSLSALTIQGVQDVMIRIELNRFARSIEPILRSGTLDEMLYLKAPESFRKDKTPLQVADSMKGSSANAMMFDMETKSFREFRARMASTSDQTLTYKGIDAYTVDGMNVLALATFEIRGSTSPEFPQPVVYARTRIKGVLLDGKYSWTLEELKFPEGPTPGV